MTDHLDAAANGKLVGQPIRRREDPALLAGAGHYVDDLAPPGTLHMAVLRSPYAKARIVSIDAEAARSAEGVRLVLLGSDVAHLQGMPTMKVSPSMVTPPHPVLAQDTVHAVGTPVAAVIADTSARALDAAALIEVEYEPLASVGDVETAVEPGAPSARDEAPDNICYVQQKAGGDVDAAFRTADHVVSARIVSPRLAAVAMEPRTALAVPEAFGGGVTLWLSSQSPSRVRADLATVLDHPEQLIRVIAPDVGGGFGSKGSMYREDVLVTFAALRLGQPVKWAGTRGEDLVTTQQGRDIVVRAELALTADGTMTGLRVRALANLGGYLQSGTAGPPTRLLAMSPGCYRIPNVSVEVVGVFTNTVPTGAYRGAGRPESVLLIERLVDKAARELKIDPAELRRKNFIRSNEFPYRTAVGAVYDSGDYGGTLAQALATVGYDALRRRRDEARERGELMGIGMATFVEPSGGAGFESGTIRIERTGRVTAITGSSSHGQGHETVFAQVVADRLQVPMDDVVIRHGDTQMGAPGVGTFGSRSAALGGGALAQAADGIIAKARRIAAHLLEAAPTDVEHVPDGFAVAGAPARKITWGAVAAAAYRSLNLPKGDTPGLEETVFFQPEREMYAYGAHVAVVHVDRETAKVTIDRIVAVDDCGIVLNPLIVEGQIIGGMAQGVGQALMEEMVFDPSGQVLSGSLLDYAVPRSNDMPPVTLGHTVTPSPRNPLGVKGVGEAGTIGAPPAILNATIDALSSRGITDLDMPLTTEKIWSALQGDL